MQLLQHAAGQQMGNKHKMSSRLAKACQSSESCHRADVDTRGSDPRELPFSTAEKLKRERKGWELCREAQSPNESLTKGTRALPSWLPPHEATCSSN